MKRLTIGIFMKQICLILSLIFSFQALAEIAVSQIRGSANRHRANTPDSILKLGDKVEIGDRISTGAGSFVKLKLKPDGSITVAPNSSLVVEEIEKAQGSTVSLLKGQLRSTFTGPKTENRKLTVKTATASLGVRGTDFHVSYNDINKVSSAISYEGQVELENSNQDKVLIPPGKFSGVYPGQETINAPVKFSPVQFAILKSNPDFAAKPTGKILKAKQISAIEQVAPINDLYNQNENLVPTPADMPDQNEQDRTSPRPGGFLDMNTGIYIAPPEDAPFDEKEGVFYPPDEYGSIDASTGEYIPPLGLILHPLNGFVLISGKIQEELSRLRQGAQKVGSTVVGGVTSAGETLLDGAKGVGNAIVEHTGKPGELLAAGVDQVGKGISKTEELVGMASEKVLLTLADSMNQFIYEGIFTRLSDLKKKTPLISKLEFFLDNQFTYSSAQRFRRFDTLYEVVDQPSFHNQFKLKTGYKQSFYKKFFARPHIMLSRDSYLRSSVPELKGLNSHTYTYGMDLGFSTPLDASQMETFFFYEADNDKREVLSPNRYNNFLKSHSFGISKLVVGRKYLTSRFDYRYTTYQSGPIGQGHQNKFSFSETFKINDRNFATFESFWSQRQRSVWDDHITNYQFKLSYFRYTKLWGLNLDLWLLQQFTRHGQEKIVRGQEKITEIGAHLKKSFNNNFSTEFSYFINDIRSKSYLLDNRSHNFSANIKVLF
jgi:hypothetical protein